MEMDKQWLGFIARFSRNPTLMMVFAPDLILQFMHLITPRYDVWLSPSFINALSKQLETTWNGGEDDGG